MIRNKDRSGWFGASDTATIMGNWATDTFRQFWGVKTGLIQRTYHSRQMEVGNILEHAVIDKVGEITGRHIRKGRFPAYRRHRLRANYDGLTRGELIEVKTSGKGFDKVPKSYWQQCQVLLYAKHRRRCELWLYTLTEEDYQAPYFAAIDPARLRCFTIDYDPDWIRDAYMPRLRYLAGCLRRGVYPHADAVRESV